MGTYAACRTAQIALSKKRVTARITRHRRAAAMPSSATDYYLEAKDPRSGAAADVGSGLTTNKNEAGFESLADIKSDSRDDGHGGSEIPNIAIRGLMKGTNLEVGTTRDGHTGWLTYGIGNKYDSDYVELHSAYFNFTP